MVEVDTGRFTVGVFQDVAWAQKGLDALKQAGSAGGVADDSREGQPRGRRRSFEAPSARPATRLELPVSARRSAAGRSCRRCREARDLAKLGLAGTMRRVGFQAHDGRIFEALTARGGVLVAIHSEPRAADALAILHSYGGGNAAIGAWTGRV